MENEEKKVYDSLSDKDKILVSEYLSTFNQCKSYMTAYEKSNYDSARTESSKKFALPNIKLAIKEKLSDIIDEKDLLTKQVIEEYKKLAFSDIRDVVNYNGVDLDIKDFKDIDTSMIKEISCKKDNIKTEGDKQTFTENINVRLYDKKNALDSLAKYLGMFVEKSEVTITNLDETFKEMKDFFGNKTGN